MLHLFLLFFLNSESMRTGTSLDRCATVHADIAVNRLPEQKKKNTNSFFCFTLRVTEGTVAASLITVLLCSPETCQFRLPQPTACPIGETEVFARFSRCA